MRVLPIEEGRVQDDRPQTSWWGAFRWASATATVPALEGEHRLAVFGRSHVYLAATAQRFASGRVEVELRRATRLLVDCPRWDPRRDSGATIAVDVAGESFLRVLLPTFGSERPDLDVPSLAGELILPRAGECAVECLRADGSIPLGSPARGAGAPGPWVAGDLGGWCWGDPPAIGAYEGR